MLLAALMDDGGAREARTRMEVGRGREGVNLGQFDAAQRCLLAAMRQSDPLAKAALGRAGLRYLAGAMGIDGETQSGELASPTRHKGG